MPLASPSGLLVNLVSLFHGPPAFDPARTGQVCPCCIIGVLTTSRLWFPPLSEPPLVASCALDPSMEFCISGRLSGGAQFLGAIPNHSAHTCSPSSSSALHASETGPFGERPLPGHSSLLILTPLPHQLVDNHDPASRLRTSSISAAAIWLATVPRGI